LPIQVWYWFRSGAPPELAPPQSRLVIPYTESTGSWLTALAASTYPATSAWTVEMLKLDSQRAAGWLAILSRITGVRESPGFAATHRATWVFGSRYSAPVSVPADADPANSQAIAGINTPTTATAAIAVRRRPCRRRTATGAPSSDGRPSIGNRSGIRQPPPRRSRGNRCHA
jgi:hypothetical protein